MTKFAILSGNTVVNIINADSLEEASVLGTAIQSTDDNLAHIQGTYDFETGKFILPVTEQVDISVPLVAEEIDLSTPLLTEEQIDA